MSKRSISPLRGSRPILAGSLSMPGCARPTAKPLPSGDVAGGPQFTHAALYQAGVVIRNALFRLPAKVDYRALPWVTYTDPELAQVGLTEGAARQQFGDRIRVVSWPFADNDRAQTERDIIGLTKIVDAEKWPHSRRLYPRRRRRRSDHALGVGYFAAAQDRRSRQADRSLSDTRRGGQARRRCVLHAGIVFAAYSPDCTVSCEARLSGRFPCC